MGKGLVKKNLGNKLGYFPSMQGDLILICKSSFLYHSLYMYFSGSCVAQMTTIQTSQLLPWVLVPTIHPHEVSLLHEIGVSILGVFQRSTSCPSNYPINSKYYVEI